MKRYFLFSLFLSICFIMSFGQTLPEKKEILYEDMWREILNQDTGTYLLNNATIVFEEQSYAKVDSLFKKDSIVNCALQIGDRAHPNLDLRFEANQFNQKQSSIQLYDLTFNKTVQLINLPNVDYYIIMGCTFHSPLFISMTERTTQLMLSQCKLFNSFNIDGYVMGKKSEYGYLNIISCIAENKATSGLYSTEIGVNENIQLTIEGNTIRSPKPDSTWFQINGACKTLTIQNTTFDIPLSLSSMVISEKVTIKDNVFQKISLGNMVYPPASGVYIDWLQLEGKMCLLETTWSQRFLAERSYYVLDRLPLYTAEVDSQLKNKQQFQELITSHFALLQIYKQNGDMENANACFVETKDLQTRRMKYQYKTEHSISTFFIWKTNQFLRYFSDYGTNPAKSVVISFYLILLFGGFYFFFYSAWDRINESFFFNRFSALFKYLTSKTTLKEFYESSNNREIKTYSQFKAELKEKQSELPRYVVFLGHLFYRLTSTRYHFVSWIISKVDIQKGLWKDLTAGKKFIIGTLLGITIFIFIIYVIVIKSLSASMLSLNAFSTLGFGNIPVKGLSKYLTVIEGFLGWLLLSIFSVSLVAQIIF